MVARKGAPPTFLEQACWGCSWREIIAGQLCPSEMVSVFIVTSLEPLPTRTSSGTVVFLCISCSWGPRYEQLFVKGNLSGVPGSH